MTLPLVNISRIPREKFPLFRWASLISLAVLTKTSTENWCGERRFEAATYLTISLPLISEVMELALTHAHVTLLKIHDIMPTWSYNNLLAACEIRNTMGKSFRIAVVQMNASPSSVQERLAQAEKFVRQSVENGAHLIVLPEVFNTGYEYSDHNYLQAESFDGVTATWMKQTSARYHVHLAGSFLRREQNGIFNTLLLVAPDGRQWHYDKNYPWLWERAYFQKGTNVTIADTEFGKIGFLICWDVAHPNLWRQYSGKVELMIVSSCPPKALDLALVFPDGKRIMSSNTGALTRYMKRASDNIFGEYLRRQASFLGVPVAQATSTGIFTSCFPNSKSSLAMLSVIYPPLLKYRSQFDRAHMEANYFNETYITDDSGNVLQSIQSDAEGVAVSNIIMPDSAPQSKGRQPAFGIPKSMYLIDSIAEMMFASEYNKKTQRYLSKQASSLNNGG